MEVDLRHNSLAVFRISCSPCFSYIYANGQLCQNSWLSASEACLSELANRGVLTLCFFIPNSCVQLFISEHLSRAPDAVWCSSLCVHRIRPVACGGPDVSTGLARSSAFYDLVESSVGESYTLKYFNYCQYYCLYGHTCHAAYQSQLHGHLSPPSSFQQVLGVKFIYLSGLQSKGLAC